MSSRGGDFGSGSSRFSSDRYSDRGGQSHFVLMAVDTDSIPLQAAARSVPEDMATVAVTDTAAVTVETAGVDKVS